MTLSGVRWMLVKAAACQRGITDKRLGRIIEHYVDQALVDLDLGEVTAVALGETATKRGQPYVNVFIDLQRAENRVETRRPAAWFDVPGLLGAVSLGNMYPRQSAGAVRTAEISAPAPPELVGQADLWGERQGEGGHGAPGMGGTPGTWNITWNFKTPGLLLLFQGSRCSKGFRELN